MRWFRLWVTMLMVLPLMAMAAERIELSAGNEGVTATVLESNDQRVVVRFDVNAFERNSVSINGETYFTLSCRREGVLLNAGEPALPRICRSVIIPDDAEMELEILAESYRDFPATRVAPSKGDLPRTVNPADVPYTFGAVYKSNEWYPQRLAALREPYILRDLRGTVIEFNAFRYLPSQGLLRVYTSVTVAVKAAGPGRINVLHRQRALSTVDPAFKVLYERHFLNYTLDENTRYSPVLEDGEMLVITADSFRTAMQPLVSWKIQKGIPTTMVNVSTVGNNAISIRNYIQSFFTSSGGNLAYVLLVGDAAQVATPMSPDSAADPTYAKVAGGDNYPDIFIGRFSAQTVAHVNTQVERSVEYERDAAAAAWYPRATGIASSGGPGHNGEYDYQHMNLIRTDLLAYGYTSMDQIYDPGATATQVTNALNAGRGIVCYVGHGSTTAWTTSGFSSTNVAALTNDNLLPFIHSVACVNGEFPSSTCFAETWLRSTRSGQPIGALATYMASINQSWDPPMESQDEAVDVLRAETRTTFGGLCFNGSCRMIDVYGSGGATMFNHWIVFGDPSVQVRTKSPVTLSVSHAATMTAGQTSFAVTVSGVQGALCALSRNDTLYGSAYTNSSGQATIPINGNPPSGQTVKLTVTALNKVTYIANITVTASTAHITVVSPNGGEMWRTGDPDTVRWTWQDFTGDVRIELNRSYPGSVWDTLAPSAANTGQYAWTVTLPATTTARMRITSLSTPTASDTSNANFTIAPPNVPPSVTHDPLHDQLPAPFTVTAIATDDYPGFTVRMHYWPEGGAQDSLPLAATANPDEFAATAGPLAEGVYHYFLRVHDAEGLSDQTDTCNFEVRPALGSEIGYDDGSAEASHWSEQAGYRWAVRFDPPQTPFLLTAANIGISAENPDGAHSPIEVFVLLADGPGNLPGTLVWSKTVGSIGNEIGGVPPEEDGWTHVAICESDGDPLALDGAFFVAVSNPSSIAREAFLHDTSGTPAGHSFVFDPCDSTWHSESEAHSSARRGNRMIRVAGLPLSTPTTVAQEEDGYLRLHWTNTGAALYNVLSSTAVGGPYSLLLSTGDTTATVARLDTAAARCFYRVISATE